jgi:hypothetical protein
MSAFESVLPNTAMREANLDVFTIASIALEVGNVRTIRHSLDFTSLPVVLKTPMVRDFRR